MAINLVTGLPGASKSYMSCLQIDYWVKRNRLKYFKRTGLVRSVRSNLRLTDEYTEKVNDMTELMINDDVVVTPEMIHWNQTHKFLEYWEDPEELPTMNNCDVIWEEMGAHVDSRSWEQLPHELRRWLQQHRHRGVQIFGNCQALEDVDVAVRRLVQECMYLVKIIGSRDPSPTTPPVKFIWGIVAILYLDARNAEKEKFKGATLGGFEWISGEVVRLYSMFNDIKAGKAPPLRHRERECTTCGKVKIDHI